MIKQFKELLADRRKAKGSVGIMTIISVIVTMIQIYLKYFADAAGLTRREKRKQRRKDRRGSDDSKQEE